MSYLGRGLVEFQVEVFVTGTVTAKVLPAVSAYCITTTTTITIHYNTHFGNLSLAAAATSSKNVVVGGAYYAHAEQSLQAILSVKYILVSFILHRVCVCVCSCCMR